jgi:hypothetical protein
MINGNEDVDYPNMIHTVPMYRKGAECLVQSPL